MQLWVPAVPSNLAGIGNHPGPIRDPVPSRDHGSPRTRRHHSATTGTSSSNSEITRSAPVHGDLVRLSEATRLLPAELGLRLGGVAVLTAGHPLEGRLTNLLTSVDLPAAGR